MTGRRRFLAAVAGIVLAAATGPFDRSLAAEKVYTGLIEGVGAGGYDIVAYHRAGRALRGSKTVTAVHEGVTYRFADTANRDAFQSEPQRYLPAYGGYCAWAVANGYTAKGDPEAWSVVDGRLYLNYSKSVRARWERDVPGNIARGDINWPDLTD